MAIDKSKYSRFLENVAEDLDIPPGKYQDAVDRYQAVGVWLEEAQYPECTDLPSIYPQGSFRLGTVVRPLRDGIEADYDIDLVCELPIAKQWTDACSVKTMVGDRLRQHHRYRKLLDREGKRCWTLKYAEQDGIGFHLDVLPSVPDPRGPPRHLHCHYQQAGRGLRLVRKQSARVWQVVRRQEQSRVRNGPDGTKAGHSGSHFHGLCVG